MVVSTGDFELTGAQLREVAQFAVGFARDALPEFERVRPGDDRPRSAIAAAVRFIDGEPRSKLQRVTSLEAHRAAKDTDVPAARCAAQAAGDAASAAYLHPIAKATQVGHILRAAANWVRIAELASDTPAAATEAAMREAQSRATPLLLEVLTRYPAFTAPSRVRTIQLMAELDSRLRHRAAPFGP